ncbi:Bicoid-interacting protein 3 (Bin3) domain containing protein [Amanita muscaria]
MEVPVYGNYHGYYSKRPAINDPRLAILPKELFVGAKVLDVGCNEGWVTCEIAQRLGAHKVVGVDIDESLVNAAWRRRRAVWSSQGPDGQPDYFPASCEHEFGPLPVPPGGKGVFPHNITFRTADWIEEEIVEDKDGYDVVIAFSLSKWVHLNGGDEAVEKFFRRVHSVLRQGGTFILEPQAWETYAKAKRMSVKLKENAKTLKLQPDDFPEVLGNVGFAAPQRLGVVGDGGE